MLSNNTLALCIPAYNAALLLPTLLTSAANQEIPFDEIYVYNDCSNDHTSEVAKAYGATVIEGDKNVGCSTGKNRLAEVAKSNWLHFHDADDDLLPNFTTVAHRWIDSENPPDIILMHYHYKVYGTNEFILEPHYDIAALKADPVKFSITDKLVNFAVIRKESFLKIGGFNTDPDVLYNEDRAFYTRATINGLSLDYDPELTCINYYFEGSMSVQNRAKCAQATSHVWDYVIENTNGKYNKEIAAQLLNNAAFAASAKDWKTVKKSISTAHNIYPIANPGGSIWFKRAFLISPYLSFFIREWVIDNLTSKRKKA